jgi:hypothetical protein
MVAVNEIQRLVLEPGGQAFLRGAPDIGLFFIDHTATLKGTPV